jgi:hypothetical protein
MTKPSHRAYLVETLPDGSDRKPRWIEVGAGWPHKQGSGFDLVISAGMMALWGRIVCVPPNAETSQG